MRGIKGDVPERITLDWLIERGACSDHCGLFDEVFPDGCEIDAASIRRAAAAGLCLQWVMAKALTREASRARRAAASMASARRARADAIEAADRACADAIEAVERIYREADGPGPRAYNEAVEAAKRTFREAVESARRIYREAMAESLIGVLFRES